MKRTHLRAVAPALPGLLALATPSMLPAAAPPLIVSRIWAERRRSPITRPWA